MSAPASPPTPATATPPAHGAWAPLGVRMFRWLWLAALFSNVGTWMHEIAAAWLMTHLSTSKLMVALVQTATTLPVFLLGLPAGALADIIDRRKLLMVAQVWNFFSAGALAVLAWSGHATPGLLLLLVALLAIGAALHRPAFQAIVPELVPRSMLRPAVTLNGISVNLARSVGPALGGLLVSAVGPWAAFAINALTFLAVLAVVYAWKPAPRDGRLPAEHLVRAVLVGLRYARHDQPLQVVLLRSGIFMACASAGWALLPVVIRTELGLNSDDYGIALAAVGIGAVSGALILPRLGKHLPTNVLVVGASLVYAGGMLAMALVREFWVLVPCLVALGMAWLSMMATLSASAQTVLPDWVRARGLSVFMLIFAGAMAGGAAAWGRLADVTSTSTSLTVAAIGAAAGCVLAPFLPLRSGELRDLSPTKHAPAHPDPEAGADDTGRVQVLVFYEIDPATEPAFREAMRDVRKLRLRTGAYAWMLYRDFDTTNTWVEAFSVPSWHEHLRQHRRITAEDAAVQDRAFAMHTGEGKPRVVHLIAPRQNGMVPTREPRHGPTPDPDTGLS